MWPSHIEENSNNQGAPSLEELEFVIHHSLCARAAKLATDVWIEPSSCRVQFVHNWWSAKGCLPFSKLKSPPSRSSAQSEQGNPNQGSTISAPNAPSMSSPTAPGTSEVTQAPNSSGCDNSAITATKGANCLQKVLDEIQKVPSTSRNSSKSTATTYGKTHVYAPMGSKHQNNLLELLNNYVDTVMEYCAGQNINPAHAFQYIHGKLPLNSLSGWQAFCQLRGALRALGGVTQALKFQAFI
jgi:hypothetical protein